jgi:uncharacterized membrane protein
MNTVIAISYPHREIASSAIVELKRLQDERVVTIANVVMVERDADGRVRSHVCDPDRSSGSSVLAAMFEKIGFSIDAMRDRKTDEAVVDQIIAKVHDESVTLGILASALDIYRFSAGIAKLGGQVVYSNLSLDDELKLVEAISKERDGDGAANIADR